MNTETTNMRASDFLAQFFEGRALSTPPAYLEERERLFKQARAWRANMSRAEITVGYVNIGPDSLEND